VLIGGDAPGTGNRSFALHILQGSSPIVARNTIVSGDSVSTIVAQERYALSVRDPGSNPTVFDNVILGPGIGATTGGVTGAAVRIEFSAAPQLRRNTISMGVTGTFGVVVREATSTVSAIEMVRVTDGSPSIIGNTFVDLSTSSTQARVFFIGKFGSAVVAPMVRNNLAYVVTSGATRRILSTSGSPTPTPTLQNNAAYLGTTATETGFAANGNVWFTSSTGVAFFNLAAQDFRLTPASAVNLRAGGLDVLSFGTDRDDQPRTLTFDGNSGAPTNLGAGVSIGAFERD
jgi:hypothetical protein